MKKYLKKIASLFGYTVITKKNFLSLQEIRTSNLDFHYLLKHVIHPGMCCFDIGANTGQTAEKFARYFPDSDIYVFEPVKNSYQQLLQNIAHLDNVKSFQCAMGAKEESVILYHRTNSEWNSINSAVNKKENSTSSETVNVTTVDDFMQVQKIDRIHFLKSDTEGFEMEVVEGAKKALSDHKIDFIYIEVGFDIADKQHTYFGIVKTTLEKYRYHFSGFFECAHGSNFQLDYANALFTKDGYELSK